MDVSRNNGIQAVRAFVPLLSIHYLCISRLKRIVMKLHVNGKVHEVDVEPQMPLRLFLPGLGSVDVQDFRRV